MDLPPCFDVLVVPDVGPTGKPRACNHGLAHAGALSGHLRRRGPARARPAPQVGAAFTEPPGTWSASRPSSTTSIGPTTCSPGGSRPSTRCGSTSSCPGCRPWTWLSRWAGPPTTSSPQRLPDLGGWNSFNVTEDADLGLRIYLQGWKTAILETTTYEEATSRYRNWIRQRSRWVKGYMQTYLFHMRQPVGLARQMGAKSFTAFQLFFGAGTLCLLLNPLFWSLALWFATSST